MVTRIVTRRVKLALNSRLAALGQDMDIAVLPVPEPDQSGVNYLNGHIIHFYGAFAHLYEKLGGTSYIGRPITCSHFERQQEASSSLYGCIRVSHQRKTVARCILSIIMMPFTLKPTFAHSFCSKPRSLVFLGWQVDWKM